ncbi:MAG: AtpZ/AtpI family protein [Bacteroidales bacterium]|nr:AtpZ/AtpI family protein [Bacteroidales bacterium]
MEKKKRSPSQPQNSKGHKPKKSGLSSYIRYSGLGFQMVAIILLFYWAGSKLDERAGKEKPVFTAILTLLGVFAGLYIVLKDFIFRKDD